MTSSSTDISNQYDAKTPGHPNYPWYPVSETYDDICKAIHFNLNQPARLQNAIADFKAKELHNLAKISNAVSPQRSIDEYFIHFDKIFFFNQLNGRSRVALVKQKPGGGQRRRDGWAQDCRNHQDVRNWRKSVKSKIEILQRDDLLPPEKALHMHVERLLQNMLHAFFNIFHKLCDTCPKNAARARPHNGDQKWKALLTILARFCREELSVDGLVLDRIDPRRELRQKKKNTVRREQRARTSKQQDRDLDGADYEDEFQMGWWPHRDVDPDEEGHDPTSGNIDYGEEESEAEPGGEEWDWM